MEQRLTYQVGEEARNRWLAARRPTDTVRSQKHTAGRQTPSDRRKLYKNVDRPCLLPR